MKKIFASALVAVSVFCASGSALAYDGWADSLATAHNMNGISYYKSYIDSPVDVDWYSWTNNTSENVNILAGVLPPSGKNYDLAAVIFYGSSAYTLPAADTGAYDKLSFSPLRPGETIYFQVRGHTMSEYSNTDEYTFTINYQD